MLKTFQPTKCYKLNSQLKIILPLMMSESIVKSTWAEDMGEFLYHLDPDTRKVTSILEKKS